MGVTDYKTVFLWVSVLCGGTTTQLKTQKKIITWQFMISFERIWKPHAEVNVRF